MVSFSLDLNHDYAHPVVQLYGMFSIIDTGAIIPVFSLPRNIIESRFRGKLVYSDKSFGGFGGGEVRGDIYSFSNFYIKQLHFKTLEAFVPYSEDISYPLLFSYTMFLNTKFQFSPIEGKMYFSVDDDKMKDNEFLIKNLADKICIQLNGVLYQI